MFSHDWWVDIGRYSNKNQHDKIVRLTFLPVFNVFDHALFFDGFVGIIFWSAFLNPVLFGVRGKYGFIICIKRNMSFSSLLLSDMKCQAFTGFPSFSDLF